MNFKLFTLAISILGIVLSTSAPVMSNEPELMFQEECKITQGISPNQDGLNDNFDLTCLADRTGISKLEMYDRNGRKIYEKNNYRNEFIGQTNSGSNLVTGTYFYVITFETEDPQYGFDKKGALYINVEK